MLRRGRKKFKFINMKLILYTDGGSRGNPGPAASGVVIKDEEGKIVRAFGSFLGKATNNFAEYTAVIESLKEARAFGADEVECRMDSQLVVRQMTGQYKIKEPHIKDLAAQVAKLATNFRSISYIHIPRELNKEADAQVNLALDKALGVKV